MQISRVVRPPPLGEGRLQPKPEADPPLCPTMLTKKLSKAEQLLDRETPWISVWTTAVMLSLTGIQISVFFTSTWQYLKQVIPGASMDLFGWVMAACSLGCAIANPVFGWWNQKTQSTKHPVTFGFALCAIGNLTYALMPMFSSNVVVIVLFARFLTGFGAGTLGVLRSFIATASTRKDRVRAVSLGTAGLTAGLALGPALQICFLPLGIDGFYIGPVLFNMYSSAAFFMFAVSLLSIVMVNVVLVEDYAGIISDEDKKVDPFLVIPTFDKIAVASLFFYWWILTGVASTEGLSAPISMAMYNWSSEEAVLYNGIVQCVSCLWSTVVYTLFGSTRLGTWDRRIHLGVGLSMFLLFHIAHSPLPFYNGPLDRIPIVNGTEVDGVGGCSRNYDWCDTTKRVPLVLYLFGFSTLLGIAFPLISAPCNTLLSEIIGPRKQGMIQGMMACWGSIAQFLVPIISSRAFELSGYQWIMFYHVVVISSGLVLLVVLRRRLVPLLLTPPLNTPTRYKSGYYYRM